MASQYAQKHLHRDTLLRQRTVGSGNSSSSKAPPKYYDYYAPLSREALKQPMQEAQISTEFAHYNPLETASRRAPGAVSAVQGYTSTRAGVPRALPVQASPATLRREGRTMIAGASHSRIFNYYQTTESRNTPTSGQLVSGSSHASSAQYSQAQYPQSVERRPIYRQTLPRVSQTPEKARVALECSVCGPGATGPWKRGPIGPYTLCFSCAQIPWREDDTGLPLTIHEALSLLDNMRLARLASVARKVSSKAEEELVHSLRRGLPESTYARAETFFSRQAQVTTQMPVVDGTAFRSSRDVAKIAVQPCSDEQPRVGQKRPRDPSDGCDQPGSDYRPSKIGPPRIAVGHENYKGQESVKRPRLTVQNDVAGLSPQSIAVAALISQSLNNPTAAARSPLTPSNANLLSTGNRDPLKECSRPKLSASNADSGNLGADASSSDLGVSSKAAVNQSPPRFARPFPFREAQSLNEQSSPRIIDRRRARNEELRRRFMKKRMDQRLAGETQAVKPEIDGRDQDASDSTDSVIKETAQADTPDSGTSQISTTSLSNISDPPASLRSLLNAEP